jgi:uncharacterized protein YndB with AHSA1/START domain
VKLPWEFLMTTAETTAHAGSDTAINLTVNLPAPPARVFAALTEPRDMEVWVWGGIGKDPKALVDLRPGGLYSVSVEVGEQPAWPRTRWTMQGLYMKIAPPTRLIYTVHWDAPVGYNEREQYGRAIDEVVVIDLVAVAADRETELHYLHMGVPTQEGAAGHRKAILHTFEILRKHLAGHSSLP